MILRTACPLLALISCLLRASAETGINAFFAPGREVRDAVRARYKFRVAQNESPYIMILFGFNRLYGPSNETYLLESNLYADGLRYADGVCTTWPLAGDYLPMSSSLRLAVPDYNQHGWTGARTLAPELFPRQTYRIDNLPNLWKTDLIAQTNLLGVECAVEIARGDLITNRLGWKCSGALDANVAFREWQMTASLGGATYTNLFALPDLNARYFTPYEILSFVSEFFWRTYRFKVFLWDLECQREGENWWLRLNQWRVTRQDDLPASYGVRLARDQGRPVIEMSNDGSAAFFTRDTVFDLSLLSAEENPPDLTIAGLSSSSTGLAAQAIPVVTTVSNAGTSVSPGFRIGVFISTDPTIDLSDQFTRSEHVVTAGLAPGGALTLSNLVTLPPELAVGNYYLGAFADYPGAVGELSKSNNTASTGPVFVSRCLPALSAGTNQWQLPRDFAFDGWLREAALDVRPGSTNPVVQPITEPLVYSGLTSLRNGDLDNNGPIYTGPEFFPYVMLDTNRQVMLLHPAQTRAAAVGFTACRTTRYQFNGAFARANNWNAGDGVVVAISRNGNITNLLFRVSIPSSRVVDTNDFFASTGIVPFSFALDLVKGETMRFLVYAGAPGTTGIGFDVTALRLTITALPPSPFRAALTERSGERYLEWPGALNETYGVETSLDLVGWEAVGTVTDFSTNSLRWPLPPVPERFRAFRIRLLP